MDEGVMVSFGDAIEGFGEQSPVATVPQPVTPPPSVSQTQAHDENLMTQEDPSVALDQENVRKKQLEDERIAEEQRRRQEELRIAEEKRRKAEEAARIAAERKAKADAARNLAGNAFSQTGGGQGETTGDAMKGNPAGHGSAGGNSWSLSGRDIVSKFYKPTYTSQQQGKIVISIRVDANGNVTSATIANGTTITDMQLRNASLEAAKKNKFSVGNGVAIGTITYKFVLN